MGSKTINKRGELKLTTLIIGIIIVFALFNATYPLVSTSIESGNYSVPAEYSESYSRVNESQTELNENLDELKNKISNTTDAPSIFQAVWNGITGLVVAIKVPLKFIDLSLNTLAIFTGWGVIPGWVSVLIYSGLLAAIVILILGLLKGESKT